LFGSGGGVPPQRDELAAEISGLVEIVTDLGVVLGAHTQATTGEGDLFFTGSVVPERWPLESLDMDVIAEGDSHLGSIRGTWPGRPVNAVDDLSQRVEVALWVVIGQLHHDPSFGVAVEGGEKRGEVTYVVKDVVTHDHVRLGGVGGNLGPAADDLCVAHPAPLGPLPEHVEHGLALVDGDKDTGRWCQGKAGGPAACAHVEY
jgi:hypothetical protein